MHKISIVYCCTHNINEKYQETSYNKSQNEYSCVQNIVSGIPSKTDATFPVHIFHGN